MIKVCAKRGECWSFPNTKLKPALDFARIGSQHGGPRRVTLCGRLVRIYENGVKRKRWGNPEMVELRRRARACR